MAITSAFYPGVGTPGEVDAQEWAESQHHLGAEYFVPSQSDWRVTAVTSATRTVRIATGSIGGQGIYDTNDANIDVQITASLPASGSKYYTIVARRTWQTDNETTVVAIAGTSARAIAATRQNDPGVIDDQPLALVRIDFGSTIAVVTDDLRAIGYNKGHYIASSTLVTTYLNKPGYRLTIGGSEWVCDLAGAWSRVSTPIEEAVSFLDSSGAGFTSANTSRTSKIVRDGRRRWMFLELKRTGGQINAQGSDGNIGNITLATLAPEDRPISDVPVEVKYLTAGGGDLGGLATVLTNGEIELNSLVPGTNIGQRPDAGAWSVQIAEGWYVA